MGFLEFLVWMFVGKLLIDLIFARKKVDELKLTEEIKEHLTNITHIVRVEELNGTYYWWDQESSEFLAQGKTVEDIVDVVKKRFPDHYFFLNNDYLLHGPEWQLKKIDN
jgi:hypothetical protein